LITARVETMAEARAKYYIESKEGEHTHSMTEDEAERTNLDELVVLVVVDAEEGEGEDGSAGNVTATVTEGVSDGRDGEEGLSRDDKDASENRGVRVVATATGTRGSKSRVCS
jgi:hypothetical protein